ncbi:hypothetical protein RZO50_14515 [Microbacterium sp. SSW1-59]|uniref:hypothetical protein n=1 Tax=Microbacterium xanthum TaxID=3079794 RepID=UPI002AD55E1B|nr:hypothetical protein [Microbacterium sp. SSW1-59]MDZ8202731.1 hypothetical protein [Microbacterium sp. SSW1-59]
MDSTPSSPQTDLFMDALSVLMSWRRIGKFSARARYRIGTERAATKTVQLTADPMRLTYALSSEEGGLREECDGYNHTLTKNGRTEALPVESLVYEAHAARLAFPLALPIWGRSSDDYRLTGVAREVPDGFDLHLVHSAEARLRGTLTVSVPRRMAVRLDTPTLFVAYEDVQWSDA